MTILEISPAALALLLLASLAHGAVIAFIYCAAGAMLNLHRLWRLERVPRPAECASLVRYERSGKKAYKAYLGVFDFFITITSACLLLVVNFIFNNGVFRLFTIPASALGFAATRTLFGRVTAMVLTYIILCIKKLVMLALAPLGRLAVAIQHIIIRIIKRIRRFVRRMRIKRYTKIQFDRIPSAERDGMPP